MACWSLPAAACWGMTMKDDDNSAYYFSRAEQEEEAARVSTNALAAKIHLSLAERYRAAAYERENGQKLRLVRD